MPLILIYKDDRKKRFKFEEIKKNQKAKWIQKFYFLK
jgi:hypothetical protein